MNYSVNSIILQILIQTISTTDLRIKRIGPLAQRAKKGLFLCIAPANSMRLSAFLDLLDQIKERAIKVS